MQWVQEPEPAGDIYDGEPYLEASRRRFRKRHSWGLLERAVQGAVQGSSERNGYGEHKDIPEVILRIKYFKYYSTWII